MKYRLIDTQRVIVRCTAEEGIVALSYSARDLVSYNDERPEWRDVSITRDEFVAILQNCPYAHNMVPSTVLWDWVQNKTAPVFLQTGDWFISTLLEDPATSMWCLHGKLYISSVGPLPGHVEIGKRFEFVLAYA
jgi:hypothetical protein